ncbi:MAG: hypothetical protein O2967_05770 [Proteobacteria bacterium]|nr:hypothetical protein [Pseudomonadota bacterium]
MKPTARVLYAALLAAHFLFPAAAHSAGVSFTEDERATILSHGPWPPGIAPDSTNRVSGEASAIALGERLFADPRLSSTGTVACATCHVAALAFTDGQPLGRGLRPLVRNTPTVLNARFNRWYGWAGAVDTLWGASIRPLLAPSEMAATEDHVARLLVADAALASLFKTAFGVNSNALPAGEILVAVGKALAAFQETLMTGRTPFDAFRDALASNDGTAMARYTQSAQRGLKIFVGRGRCSFCHMGSSFTNGEFDDAGISYFISAGKVDKGRYEGIRHFRQSSFSGSGGHSDNPHDANANLTRHVSLQQRDWGAFKVPSLRNVAQTAPYMHNGSLASLHDVARHYSEINTERLHTNGTAILRPLHLTAVEIDDLVAFLESLTSGKLR